MSKFKKGDICVVIKPQLDQAMIGDIVECINDDSQGSLKFSHHIPKRGYNSVYLQSTKVTLLSSIPLKSIVVHTPTQEKWYDVYRTIKSTAAPHWYNERYGLWLCGKMYTSDCLDDGVNRDHNNGIRISYEDWVKYLKPQVEQSKSDTFEVGEIVVVTENYMGNSAKEGMIVKIDNIDQSGIPYCIEYYDKDGNSCCTWCVRVRKVTDREKEAYNAGFSHLDEYLASKPKKYNSIKEWALDNGYELSTGGCKDCDLSDKNGSYCRSLNNLDLLLSCGAIGKMCFKKKETYIKGTDPIEEKPSLPDNTCVKIDNEEQWAAIHKYYGVKIKNSWNTYPLYAGNLSKCYFTLNKNVNYWISRDREPNFYDDYTYLSFNEWEKQNNVSLLNGDIATIGTSPEEEQRFLRQFEWFKSRGMRLNECHAHIPICFPDSPTEDDKPTILTKPNNKPKLIQVQL